MPRMYWIKVWTEEWLDGSIREELTPTQRSIWIDLLVLAGRSRTPGIIQSNPQKGYSEEYLAHRFAVPLQELKASLRLFADQKRIRVNGTGIEIINWHKYQDSRLRRKEEN